MDVSFNLLVWISGAFKLPKSVKKGGSIQAEFDFDPRQSRLVESKIDGTDNGVSMHPETLGELRLIKTVINECFLDSVGVVLFS
jgi:hypothetical protein